MKIHHISWFLFIAVVSLLLAMCSKPSEPEFDSPYDKQSDEFIPHPDLVTLEVDSVRALEAWSGGVFTNDYGSPVTAKGVCWSIEEEPTTDDACSNDGEDLEAFESHINDLEPGQNYYVRAYATNAEGTVYGEQRSFTTLYMVSVNVKGEGQVIEKVVSEKATNHSYPPGTKVEFTAEASYGWEFSHWEGDATGSEKTILLGMDRNKEITAVFERGEFPVIVTIEGRGSVEQEVVQAKASQTDYPFETLVQLTAVPEQGWVFSEWSGDTSGTDETIVIEVDEEKQVTATFLSTATVVTASITEITLTSAQSGGEITDDGGSSVTQRGVCWSTEQNPTTSDNCTRDGSGTGSFTSSLTNLDPETQYYVRAYAINSEGTAFGNQRDFTTEAEADGTEVVEVTSPTGRVWMDRNLGASRAATSMDDEEAYGDLYQWGRSADGHQKRNSGTTSTLSNSDQPGHGDFILTSNSPLDWRFPQNDNLWQGINGVNNPCPDGYRLPTEAEWEVERQSWSSNNASGAFSSPLKLPVAGYRSDSNGSLRNVDSGGFYWSSSVSNLWAWDLGFDSGFAGMGSDWRAFGFSIRCIKD